MGKKPGVLPLCNTCYYWQPLPSPGRGLCHRQPPPIDSVTWLMSTSAFSETASGDWCGEYSGETRDVRP